ncbi:hypothetical protein [Paenibacillus silvisoli]|uniref:hypothetical protein n=1 Tax=Paenibacillus silvisoli TaxID=3110539 RepID=UPI0028039D9E|nr:hypothetical protein [Paenibacillus silvisoli]
MGASTIFSYLHQYGEENISSVIDIDQTPKILNDEEGKFGMYDSEKIDFDFVSRHPTGRARGELGEAKGRQ